MEDKVFCRCLCNVCSESIEFPEGGEGQTIKCPHCQCETILYCIEKVLEEPPKETAKPPSRPPPPLPAPEFAETDADREWLETELADLQEDGFAKKRISSSQKADMLRVQGEIGYDSVIDLLSERFPHLLTASGRKQKAEDDQEYRQIQRTGEFAPTVTIGGVGPRGENDPPATAKQIAYLRDLGVRDESLLARLGKSQASAVIEKALEVRNKAFIEPEKSGCLGVILICFSCGGLLWFLLRW